MFEQVTKTVTFCKVNMNHNELKAMKEHHESEVTE